MKDEEMAKEYLEKNVCGHCKQCNGAYIGCDKYRYAKQSFLAGLKAGRPQWHNPSEKLPERCTTVLNEDGGKVYYDYSTKCWRYDDADSYISSPPIAWCEIPTFDKE